MSSLGGDEWSTSRPSRFTLEKVHQYLLNSSFGGPSKTVCIRENSLAPAGIRTTVRSDRGPITTPTTQSLLISHRCAVACHVSEIKTQPHICNEFDEYKRMVFNTSVTSWRGGGGNDHPIFFQTKDFFFFFLLKMGK
jgi:hypothetical protein